MDGITASGSGINISISIGSESVSNVVSDGSTPIFIFNHYGSV